MIDEYNFTYTPFEFPNVLSEVKQDEAMVEGEPIAYEIHPFMHPLIARLAKARPNWKLVARGHILSPQGAARWASRFAIYEGKEELGWVRKSWRGDGDVFEYDARRLSNTRKRGNSTMTKDHGKAFKDITRAFAVKSNSELLGEAITKVRNVVNGISSNATYERNKILSRLDDAMTQFARTNWDMFRDFAIGFGVSTEVLNKAPGVYVTREAALKLYSDCSHKHGTFVLLREGEYILHQGDRSWIAKREDLTPHLQRAIGMLKLAPINQHLPGMGVRASDTAMFIEAEQKEATHD